MYPDKQRPRFTWQDFRCMISASYGVLILNAEDNGRRKRRFLLCHGREQSAIVFRRHFQGFRVQNIDVQGALP